MASIDGALAAWAPQSLLLRPQRGGEGETQKRPRRAVSKEPEAGPTCLCLPLICTRCPALGSRSHAASGSHTGASWRRPSSAESPRPNQNGRVWGAFSQVGATEGQGSGVRAAQLALETLGPRACGRNDLVLGEFHSVPGLARATLRPRSGHGETASYRWTRGLRSTAGRAWSQ